MTFSTTGYFFMVPAPAPYPNYPPFFPEVGLALEPVSAAEQDAIQKLNRRDDGYFAVTHCRRLHGVIVSPPTTMPKAILSAPGEPRGRRPAIINHGCWPRKAPPSPPEFARSGPSRVQ
jgi:hypothetical protein